MLNWSHVTAQQERYQDLLCQAEQDGLYEQMQAGRTMRDRFHCRVLTWLGDRLVAWGRRLQARYGPPAVAICPSACSPYPVNR